MKKADIKVGATYVAKVTNRLVQVRIDAENPSGGWDATNLTTKKKIRIKTAGRLRESKGALKAIAAADQEHARLRDERKANKDGQTASERAMRGSSKSKRGASRKQAASKAKASSKAPANATDAKPKKRTGILDAAAQILAKSKEPMGCKEIVELAIAQKLWATNGQTPSATLYAAISREISKKGKEARFEKVDRGRFQLRSAKKGA